MSDDAGRAADGRPIGRRAENGGARRGFAGVIDQARETAPDGATEGEINDVAFVAWMQDRRPADVWNQMTDRPEFGGGPL